jgi:hypothetical protein
VPDRYSVSSRLQLLEFALATNVEQLRSKEISEKDAQNKIIALQTTLEREQNQARERINQIEEMADKEKQRILKHLEDEKRFTRDIIDKSETMIKQLKRELSSERRRTTDEHKAQQSLRDIYKKIPPRQVKVLTKNPIHTNENMDVDDDHDESRLDGETTVYHKDDPFFASTPRDHSLLTGRNENSDYNALQRQLEEQLKDENDENDDIDNDSFSNDQRGKSNLTTRTSRSSLPPTPKRRTNTKFHSSVISSFEGTRPTVIEIDTTSHKEGKFNMKSTEN